MTDQTILLSAFSSPFAQTDDNGPAINQVGSLFRKLIDQASDFHVRHFPVLNEILQAIMYSVSSGIISDVEEPPRYFRESQENPARKSYYPGCGNCSNQDGTVSNPQLQAVTRYADSSWNLSISSSDRLTTGA